MRTTIRPMIGAIIIMVMFLAGCGSASAPPVELPAPITGRIDVSSPDENGDVTVTGSEGAVTGGTIVMVVNEDEAGPVTTMLMELLVRSAYAQTFPGICSEAAHACTDAAEDGSFQVVIPGAVGNTLVIGLIDENGDWISDVIRVIVPPSGTPEPTENCAGEGVFGDVVDIKIAPSSGIPVMLKQGSESTTNQLVIGETSPVTVSITGCYAHSLAFFKSAIGDSIAVTSKDDKKLWAGRFVDGEVLDRRSFTLDYEPMHIAYVDQSALPTVAIRKTDNTVRLARISSSEGVILDEMILTEDTAEITGLTRSVAIDVLPMEDTAGHYLGLLITDTGTSSNSYVTLFQADGIIHKGTWSRITINLESPDPAKAISTMVDGKLYVWEVTTLEYLVRLAIVDSASTQNVVANYAVRWDSLLGVVWLSWKEDIAPIPFVPPLVQFKTETAVPVGPLNRMAITRDKTTSPAAVVVSSDGSLLERLLEVDILMNVIADWAPGHDIVAIDAMPAPDDLLYGADATADAIIDGSSLVPW